MRLFDFKVMAGASSVSDTIRYSGDLPGYLFQAVTFPYSFYFVPKIQVVTLPPPSLMTSHLPLNTLVPGQQVRDYQVTIGIYIGQEAWKIFGSLLVLPMTFSNFQCSRALGSQAIG